MEIGRGAEGSTLGFNLCSHSLNKVLHLLAVHLMAGKQVEIIGATMIQIKQTQSAAAREKKAFFPGEPSTQKVTL